MKEAIARAIGAHGAWKVKLKQAISAGQIDGTPTSIGVDNACEFGKWLYGPSLSADVKRSAIYARTQTLHQAFHHAASQVAELAVANRTADAQKLMASGGAFAVASAALTTAMMEWSRTAK